MAKIKMKYGIDLGTTNSAICKMESGKPIIKKTDTLKDTLPSCVAFTRRGVSKVGDTAYNNLRSDRSKATQQWAKLDQNVFIEFKRTMGLDTRYESANLGRGVTSEELSAEVLKTLKSFVQDDQIDAAIITIPAKFKMDQIAATKRAAQLAGINYCELLQEPIAAAMAYGLTSEQKNGNWVVFDFGGGTFDAALLKVEDGIMQVIDTEGDNYLGGKNLDYAIVDEIIIPHLREEFAIDNIMADDKMRQILRDAMKYYAEQAKNQLSFKDKTDITSQLDEFGDDDEGVSLELDMIVTAEQLSPVLSPIFQKAIDITISLLKRNNLQNKLDKLILVGGPTHSPILRQMLREQVTPNVDTSIDPMTAVAAGAALYASTVDIESEGPKQAGTIALDIQYEANSVETMEFITVKLLPDQCTGAIPPQLFVELTRSEGGWASGKVPLNEMGDVVECQLLEGRANSFTIKVYNDSGNELPCFPNEITIIQGSKVGSATLPYHVGIEAHDVDRNIDVFVPVKGLEKNQQLPATGVCNGLKTPKDMRPGVEEDRLVISIYQGEHNAKGKSAIYNDHVFDVVITGDDLPALVPANSDIDVTLKINASQEMTMKVNFIAIGEEVEKEVPIGTRSGVSLMDLENRIKEAKRKLRSLQTSSAISSSETQQAEKLLNEVEDRFDGEKHSEDGKMHLLADLRRAFLEMEDVEQKHEWDSLETQLRDEFTRLEDANNDLGNKYDREVQAMRRAVDQALRSHDVKTARSALIDTKSLFVRVTLIYQLIGFVKYYTDNFSSTPWKNASRARQLLDQGQSIIADNPTTDRLFPIYDEVWDLIDIPENEKPRMR